MSKCSPLICRELNTSGVNSRVSLHRAAAADAQSPFHRAASAVMFQWINRSSSPRRPLFDLYLAADRVFRVLYTALGSTDDTASISRNLASFRASAGRAHRRISRLCCWSRINSALRGLIWSSSA